jgi:hypothetical protein
MINYVEASSEQLYFHADNKTEIKWWYVKTIEEGVEILNQETFSSHMRWHENILESSDHERMLLEIVRLTKSEAEVE